MAGRTSRDYARYEAEFVTSDFTMRGFAAEKGLQVSSLARMARKPDENGLTWYDKKAAYKARTTEKAYEILADKDALQVSARMEQILRINDRLLGVIEKQIPVWEEQIAAGKTPISPRDVTAVIDQMRVLLGQTGSSQSKEDRRLGFLGIVASDGIPDIGLAAQLERATRPLISVRGSEEADSGTGAEGTVSN